MAAKSSYLRFLPPVLWEKEPDLPAFSLGAMLRIFEKLLTGIDDGIPISDGGTTYEPIEAIIARIPRLFDPYLTPAEFLPWLAGWLDLEISPIWEEYQTRKAIAGIVQIYMQRGLRQGLFDYLDLYSVSATRPRIVIDDGCRVLFLQPQPAIFAPITALISQGPFARSGVLSHDGMVRPLCITRAPDGSLIVGDEGTPDPWTPVIRKGVWQLPPPGRYEFANSPAGVPEPQRLGPPAWNLLSPIAVVTDSATPWNLYVLDLVLIPGEAALYQLTSPDFPTATVLATRAQLNMVWPIAMAMDTNGHLLILDRGVSLPSGAAAAPTVIDIQIQPFAVTSHNLAQVIEPLSMTVLPNGFLLIGDGRQQDAPVPADIVQVDRTNALNWVETPLLAAVPPAQNPLVAPMAVVRQDDTHILVLDLGLKPHVSVLDPAITDPFHRQIAEPADVYLVDLGPAPPVVTRASETGQLVYPTGMVFDGDRLAISDRGEYSDPDVAGPLMRVWRALSDEFGVVIYFSEQRPTTQQQRRRIVEDINGIVNSEKPAHTLATMAFAP